MKRAATIVIILACFLIFAFVVIAPQLGLRDRTLSKSAAEESLRSELRQRWDLPLPPGTRVIHSVQGAGHEGGQWWQFIINSNDIDELKSSLIAKGWGTKGLWVMEDKDDLATFIVFGSHSFSPKWWKPDEMNEPDILRLHTGPHYANGYWFAFSRENGLVYMFRYDS